jgi:hypothetical protein
MSVANAIIILPQQKEEIKMSNISTALAISEACKESVYDEDTISIASQIFAIGGFSDEIADLLLRYSATLSAGVATRVIAITMTKTAVDNMMSELSEMGEFDNL